MGDRAQPGGVPGRPPAAGHRFAEVVVALESTPALKRPPDETPTTPMALRGGLFVPRVLAIVAGTEVTFPNQDSVHHSVFSLSSSRGFDLGRYARGVSKAVRFHRAGVVQVFCRIHAGMSAYVLAYDHPFFVVPDAQGRFTLERVPPGVYHLTTWHERVRPIRMLVRVEAGRTATARIAIPPTEGTGAP